YYVSLIVRLPLEPIPEFTTTANVISLADHKPMKATKATCQSQSVLVNESAPLALEQFHTV
ncbi:hypothetical protein J6590_094610, partial [Homalodisca vitripennis]